MVVYHLLARLAAGISLFLLGTTHACCAGEHWHSRVANDQPSRRLAQTPSRGEAREVDSRQRSSQGSLDCLGARRRRPTRNGRELLPQAFTGTSFASLFLFLSRLLSYYQSTYSTAHILWNVRFTGPSFRIIGIPNVTAGGIRHLRQVAQSRCL